MQPPRPRQSQRVGAFFIGEQRDRAGVGREFWRRSGRMLGRVILLAVASIALPCGARSIEPATRPTIPVRPADAPGGREFAGRIAAMPLAEREAAILAELKRGNVPD